MNKSIIHPEVELYLRANLSTDVRKFALKKSPFSELSSADLSQQLKGLQIAQHKLPYLFACDGIYYPPTLNLEQSSSWATAQYKANLVEGDSLIDLTAGFGVDVLAFAQKFSAVTGIERNAELVEIVKHNLHTLNLEHVHFKNSNFEEFLFKSPHQIWDVLYLDPSRRVASQRKADLEDLEPNIVEWMNQFLAKAKTVMVKLSPLQDLKSMLQKVPFVHQIHIIALKNEVKEILIICQPKVQTNPELIIVNLETQQPEIRLHWEDESASKAIYSEPQKYIYEPSAAMMKSGAFNWISENFKLHKLHPRTHLYTSEQLLDSFPGKIFELQNSISEQTKKQIKKHGFHVISKNYPLTVEEIRKKYQLKESDEQTLIFTQSINSKHILACKRIH